MIASSKRKSSKIIYFVILMAILIITVVMMTGLKSNNTAYAATYQITRGENYYYIGANPYESLQEVVDWASPDDVIDFDTITIPEDESLVINKPLTLTGNIIDNSILGLDGIVISSTVTLNNFVYTDTNTSSSYAGFTVLEGGQLNIENNSQLTTEDSTLIRNYGTVKIEDSSITVDTGAGIGIDCMSKISTLEVLGTSTLNAYGVNSTIINSYSDFAYLREGSITMYDTSFLTVAMGTIQITEGFTFIAETIVKEGKYYRGLVDSIDSEKNVAGVLNTDGQWSCRVCDIVPGSYSNDYGKYTPVIATKTIDAGASLIHGYEMPEYTVTISSYQAIIMTNTIEAEATSLVQGTHDYTYYINFTDPNIETVSFTESITAAKANLEVEVLPTFDTESVEYFQYGTSISGDNLIGGTVKPYTSAEGELGDAIEGSWEFFSANNDNTLKTGTNDYNIRFIPTQSNYYNNVETTIEIASVAQNTHWISSGNITNLSLNYGQRIGEITIAKDDIASGIRAPLDDTVPFIWTDSSTIPDIEDSEATEYEITAKVKAEEEDYGDVVLMVTIIVEKATPQVDNNVYTTSTDLEYNDFVTNAIIDSSSVNVYYYHGGVQTTLPGTWAYENPNEKLQRGNNTVSVIWTPNDISRFGIITQEMTISGVSPKEIDLHSPSYNLGNKTYGFRLNSIPNLISSEIEENIGCEITWPAMAPQPNQNLPVNAYNFTVDITSDNPNYLFTNNTGVSITFTVIKKNVTITSKTKEYTYGTSENIATAAKLSFVDNNSIVSQLAAGEDISVLADITITVNDTDHIFANSTRRNVGEYDYNLSYSAHSNYNFTGVAGKIKIVPAIITVTTTPSKDSVKPNEVSTLTYAHQYAGFVYSQTVDELTKLPTVNNLPSDAGVYDTLRASGAEAANYTFVYTPFTLTILQNKIVSDDASITGNNFYVSPNSELVLTLYNKADNKEIYNAKSKNFYVDVTSNSTLKKIISSIYSAYSLVSKYQILSIVDIDYTKKTESDSLGVMTITMDLPDGANMQSQYLIYSEAGEIIEGVVKNNKITFQTATLGNFTLVKIKTIADYWLAMVIAGVVIILIVLLIVISKARKTSKRIRARKMEIMRSIDAYVGKESILYRYSLDNIPNPTMLEALKAVGPIEPEYKQFALDYLKQANKSFIKQMDKLMGNSAALYQQGMEKRYQQSIKESTEGIKNLEF